MRYVEGVDPAALTRQEEHEWASERFLAGIDLLERHVAGEPLDLDEAIQAFSDAITVWTPARSPRNWARAKFNLGNCYLRRRPGLRAENVEQAIAEYLDALSKTDFNHWPEHWANVQDGLGRAFRVRVAGNAAENFEQSIEHLQKALALRARLPDRRAHVLSLNNLANAYLERIRGSATDNTERALALYQQAAAILQAEAEPDPDLAALVFQNLGLAYRDRLYGDPETDQEKAAEFIGLAIAIYQNKDAPLAQASALTNLASVYLMERFRALAARDSDLALSVQYLTTALGVLDEHESPELWATAQVLLGQALVEQATLGRREENLRDAIRHFSASLRVRTIDADPFGWAQAQQNLGNAHSMLGEMGEGVARYELALQVFTADFPVERRRTLKSIALSWFGCGEFEKAMRPFEEAIAIGEGLLRESNAPEAKQAEAAEISTLYPNVAYSLLALGRPEQALMMLERGKTRLIAQALAISDPSLRGLGSAERARIQTLRDEIRGTEALLQQTMRDGTEEDLRALRAKLGDLRARLWAELAANAPVVRGELAAQDILELARPGECLVAPLITARGGAVFVIPHGTVALTDANILWLDALELYQMLHPAQPVYETDSGYGQRAWLRWYGVWRSDTSEETFENRSASMERLLQSLWAGLWEPVWRIAEHLGVHSLVILPQGGLQLLPLHGAFRNEDGERRYLLDDFVVQYAPSAWILQQCRKRSGEMAATRRAVCFSVKRYQDFLRLRTLPFASSEADAVERITAATVLRETDATSAAVIAHAPQFTHFHFACHATLSNNPLDVALQLGGRAADKRRDELPVRRIVADLRLEQARLITMAACESGVVEHLHSADEYVGLPGALLQAGAAAVINSLLVVHDLASCLLWGRFYGYCWGEHMKPAAALRKAQLWLRDAGREELHAVVRTWRHEESEAGKALLAGLGGDRPFAHPFYWVGFVCVGA